MLYCHKPMQSIQTNHLFIWFSTEKYDNSLVIVYVLDTCKYLRTNIKEKKCLKENIKQFHFDGRRAE